MKARLAQSVEHWSYEPRVVSSSLTSSSGELEGNGQHGCPSWSKGADLRPAIFVCVGSNPTAAISCFQTAKTKKFHFQKKHMKTDFARLAQSVERKTFNLVVVGSSPTAGTPGDR